MLKYKLADVISLESEQQLISFPPLLRRLLHSRGVRSADAAEVFLNPSYDAHTHDPFLMKDMEKTVGRILRAVQNNERIAIWSDYDADGIPGAVALHDFFKKIGYGNFENYIPDRHGEGFGLNVEGIEELATRGARLFITIDCGIADVKEIARANELGMEVIITDHHLPACFESPLTKGALPSPACADASAGKSAGGMSTTPALADSGTPFIKGDLIDQLPPAYAILNPKQSDCEYPGKMLCGAGVVFKLIQALCLRLRSPLEFGACGLGFPAATFPSSWEKWLLDMVGIATLSDMVPLTGENRVFAYYGLKVLRKSPRVGLGQLLRELRLNQQDLTEDDIGFTISPRINAASRMGAPMDAFRLFATTDEAEAGALAKHLNKINSERKGKVASLVKEVRRIVAERHLETSGVHGTPDVRRPHVIVAGNPNWRPALLGLVANALVEDYQKPVFVWGREGSIELKGSCRSDGSVDLSLLMQEASSVFADFGGHREAGGFSVALEKVHLLETELERAYEKVRISAEAAEPQYIVDARLSLEEVNWDLWRDISKMAPFGIGNPKPLFLFEKVEARKIEQFGKEKQHLKIIFEKQNGEKVSAIKFFSKPEDFGLGGSTSSFRSDLKSGDRSDLDGLLRLNLLAHLEKSSFGNYPELRLRIVDII